MSRVVRFFGSRRGEALSANSVLISDDLATALTRDGTPLQVAVENALRDHLSNIEDAASKPAADTPESEAMGAMPFWLDRDSGGSRAGDERREEPADIEEELRERVIHRQPGQENDPLS
ncbi:MAG TPA: hypothetical protein VE219_04725 [Candidatus Sulfotelmatobacter sp.]|nr:hypothetical protein [Candidatus Sulfotelmatobacter sp.]